jgi:Predicted membrane-associated HD superfamily hydrolase
MKKKKIFIISATLFLMCIPFFTLEYLIPPTAQLAAVILLLYAVNPLFSIIVGVISGLHIKKLWYMSFIPTLVFLISLSFATSGLRHTSRSLAIVYLVLSLTFMLITARIKSIILEKNVSE